MELVANYVRHSNDLYDINALAEASLGHLRAQDLRPWLHHTNRGLIVAYDSSVVIGFGMHGPIRGCLTKHRRDADDRHIACIGMDPKFRSDRLANELLSAIENECGRYHAGVVYAAGKVAPRALFSQHGFTMQDNGLFFKRINL